MKFYFSKFHLLLFFSFSFSILYSQQFNFSVVPFLTLQNKNFEHSYGLQIGAEYYLYESVSLNLSTGYYSPNNNLEDTFLAKIPTSILWIDLIAKIYPLNNFPNQYIGMGIGRYFVDREWIGHPKIGERYVVYEGNLDDSFGLQFLIGSKLDRGMFFELKYILNYTEMKRKLSDRISDSYLMETKEVNLSTLLIMVGIEF